MKSLLRQAFTRELWTIDSSPKELFDEVIRKQKAQIPQTFPERVDGRWQPDNRLWTAL